MGYDRRHDSGRRQHENSSRFSYDERDDDYYDRSRDRNIDNSYRSYKDQPRDGRYDDSRERYDDRRTDRLSPGYHHDRSRSPYHTSNYSRSYNSRSVSRSPERGGHRKTPPGESTSTRKPDYYDRDAPENNGGNFGGQPSRDVILEGIHADMNDDDIQKELDKYEVEGIKTVTLIRERKSNVSRGFAFARFLALPDSKKFMDRFYPIIDLGELCPRVKIAYSKERDESSTGQDDWRCNSCLMTNFPRRTRCYRCDLPRADSAISGSLTQAPPSFFSNDGTKDIGQIASQFVLFRGLEPTVSEELLLKGALKLASSSAAIKRILLIRDRRTNESWRFGFAEFISVEESKIAFNKYQENASGYTISSKPVTVSYIHPGVFVPVFHTRPGSERWTFEPLGTGGGGVKLAYWDEEGYASVLLAEGASKTAEPGYVGSQENSESKNKVKKKEKDIMTVVDGDKSKKRKADPNLPKDSAPASKKAVPSHLQFWQNRHEELHSGQFADHSKDTASDQDGPPERSYANLEKMCCYLCTRQFKSEAEVHKHERISALHRKNLQDETLKKTAEAKLAKCKSAIDKDQEHDSAYRDRAKERREIHKQPANPGATRGQQKAKEFSTGHEEEPEPAAVVNKGASLLSKMGWTEGKGLGAQGTGITAPVVAGMYVEGVGLGAVGGKIGDVVEGAPGDVGGYQGFVQRTKDKSYERYEQMKNGP